MEALQLYGKPSLSLGFYMQSYISNFVLCMQSHIQSTTTAELQKTFTRRLLQKMIRKNDATRRIEIHLNSVAIKHIIVNLNIKIT